MRFSEYIAEYHGMETNALKVEFDIRLKLFNKVHEKRVGTIEHSFEHTIKVSNDQIQLHEQHIQHDMDIGELHYPRLPRPWSQSQPQTPAPPSSQTQPPRTTVMASLSKPNSLTGNVSSRTKVPKPDNSSPIINACQFRRSRAKLQAQQDAVPANSRK